MKYFPRLRTLLAVTTAVLWWLSLQKIGLFAFGWIALTPLLLAASTLPQARERFWFGWRGGFWCFALINWWLLPTITKASPVIGIPSVGGALLGVLSVAIIAAGHGLGVAFLALLWNPGHKLFIRAPLLLPVAAALFWFAFENVRAYGTLANTWGALSFSQWSDPALLQSARIIGQDGLSALCVWFAASVALWLKPEYSAMRASLWRVPVAVWLVLHTFGGWRIVDYDLGEDNRRSDSFPLTVALVQTAVSNLATNESPRDAAFDQAWNLTTTYFSRNKRRTLYIWPESTSVFYVEPDTQNINAHTQFALTPSQKAQRSKWLADELSIGILTGAQVVHERSMPESDAVFNSAVLFSPNADPQRSDKRQLVPFGERAPWSEYVPFLKKLAPDPPVTPGASQVLIMADGGSEKIPVGTLICFESTFPEPAKTLTAKGARVLFVLTNDEWFTGTTAPWEHAAMSTVRAVENDVPVLQSANGGYSFHIDARGRFLKILDYGHGEVLVTETILRPQR